MARQGGYTFPFTTVKDNAQVHQGDSSTHHHHYGRTAAQEAQTDYDKSFEFLHKSLAYSGIGTRQRVVESAWPQTCKWLLSHTEFLKWTDRQQIQAHHGVLWLKGKPGSGKSTIMKETLEWAQNEWSDQTTLSYFFNARSMEELDKSSLGLYRSLVYQLVSSWTDLKSSFVREFGPKITNQKIDGETVPVSITEWKEIELQEYLLRQFKTPHVRALNLFIDALDEGEDDDIRRMMGFF